LLRLSNSNVHQILVTNFSSSIDHDPGLINANIRPEGSNTISGTGTGCWSLPRHCADFGSAKDGYPKAPNGA